MLSKKTCIELIAVAESYVERITDRIFTVFDLDHMIHPANGKFNHQQKLNILLKELFWRTKAGPFSDSFRMDLLQYIVDHFYRYQDEPGNSGFFRSENLEHIPYESRFAYKYPALTNAVKRDGYIIKGREISKMLPQQIEEAKTETELETLLTNFNFQVTLGHLKQAITNHSSGQWASANSQFRTFIESLLMEICNKLLPANKCVSAAAAIKLLSKTVNPAFLLESLNEVESPTCDKPFIEGLWKRLHPSGNHPGLSDEDDCTFRYHITIVTGYNLLSRLSKYK